MGVPQVCPFCRSFDIRRLGQALDAAGYRCHDCARTFYVDTPAQQSPDGSFLVQDSDDDTSDDRRRRPS